MHSPCTTHYIPSELWQPQMSLFLSRHFGDGGGGGTYIRVRKRANYLNSAIKGQATQMKLPDY